VLVIPFPMVCGTLHNSSRLESYGHEKLENLGLGNGSNFVLWIMERVLIYLQAKILYMDSTCHAISSGMWNVT
jgi:hypothetical protein